MPATSNKVRGRTHAQPRGTAVQRTKKAMPSAVRTNAAPSRKVARSLATSERVSRLRQNNPLSGPGRGVLKYHLSAPLLTEKTNFSRPPATFGEHRSFWPVFLPGWNDSSASFIHSGLTRRPPFDYLMPTLSNVTAPLPPPISMLPSTKVTSVLSTKTES